MFAYCRVHNGIKYIYFKKLILCYFILEQNTHEQRWNPASRSHTPQDSCTSRPTATEMNENANGQLSLQIIQTFSVVRKLRCHPMETSFPPSNLNNLTESEIQNESHKSSIWLRESVSLYKCLTMVPLICQKNTVDVLCNSWSDSTPIGIQSMSCSE